jgi:putative hemolysin
MMMLLTGRLPKVADTIEWQDWKFEIVDMDGKTIDKVLASSLSTDATENDSEATVA